MCDHGNERLLLVPMPAELSHTGKFRWVTKGVDQCIAPIVEALNNAGVLTANSCCGHGERDGSILLHDGREIIIKPAKRPRSALSLPADSVLPMRGESECRHCGRVVLEGRETVCWSCGKEP